MQHLNQFLVQSSVTVSTFTTLNNHRYYAFPECSFHPQKKTPILPSALPQILGTTILLSFSVNLPYSKYLI